MNNKNKEIKEEFCTPCLMAIPMAMGVGGAAGSSAANNKKLKKILLFGGLGLILISIIVFIYLKSRCTTCR